MGDNSGRFIVKKTLCEQLSVEFLVRVVKRRFMCNIWSVKLL
jgi:hypothetical protein